MSAAALIVLGARSGTGKTIVTIGLQRAFMRAGHVTGNVFHLSA